MFFVAAVFAFQLLSFFDEGVAAAAAEGQDGAEVAVFGRELDAGCDLEDFGADDVFWFIFGFGVFDVALGDFFDVNGRVAVTGNRAVFSLDVVDFQNNHGVSGGSDGGEDGVVFFNNNGDAGEWFDFGAPFFLVNGVVTEA